MVVLHECRVMALIRGDPKRAYGQHMRQIVLIKERLQVSPLLITDFGFLETIKGNAQDATVKCGAD
jgi:hypothetical protein